ncbi:MAG: hypothetical protein GX942_04345 [Papillibacter sp.]|nr:hypothetical protein [Papillibacter sp.]
MPENNSRPKEGAAAARQRPQNNINRQQFNISPEQVLDNLRRVEGLMSDIMRFMKR